MNTRNLVTWLSPLAVALLAFGSQIALAQEAAPLTRAEVQAEALQAQKSGALERQRITSYSTTQNWGPGAPANTSERARAQGLTSRPAANGDATPEAQAKKTPAARNRNPA